jgi:hypothetical protein
MLEARSGAKCSAERGPDSHVSRRRREPPFSFRQYLGNRKPALFSRSAFGHCTTSDLYATSGPCARGASGRRKREALTQDASSNCRWTWRGQLGFATALSPGTSHLTKQNFCSILPTTMPCGHSTSASARSDTVTELTIRALRSPQCAIRLYRFLPNEPIFHNCAPSPITSLRSVLSAAKGCEAS